MDLDDGVLIVLDCIIIESLISAIFLINNTKKEQLAITVVSTLLLLINMFQKKLIKLLSTADQ